MSVAVQFGTGVCREGGWGAQCRVGCNAQQRSALAQSAITAAAEERRARSERSAVSPCDVTALCHCHRCVFPSTPTPRAVSPPRVPGGGRGGGCA